MRFTNLFTNKKLKEELETLKELRRNETKAFMYEINNLNEKLKKSESENQEVSDKLLDCKHKLANYLNGFVESKEYDINSFSTNEYRTQFITFIDNGKYTKKEILDKFNELKYKDNISFEVISECIDFIRNKRKPKSSIESQLIKYILTDNGRDNV